MTKVDTGFSKDFAVVPRLTGSHMIDEAHSNRHARLLHRHDDMVELFYVYSGEGQYMVDGHIYQVRQGDMLICNQSALHGEDPSAKRHMRSYSIALADVQRKDLPPGQLIDSETEPIISYGALAEQVGQMMRLIHLLQARHGHLEQVCTHTALAVLLLTHELLCSRARTRKKRQLLPTSLLARRIQDYLDNHYAEPISLGSIAQALYISEYYLSHVFKEEHGLPPMQYVMKRRIGEAQTLLIDTLLPIAEVAARVGYENPWNFSSAFRRCVGSTPSQYRRSFLQMAEKSDSGR